MRNSLSSRLALSTVVAPDEGSTAVLNRRELLQRSTLFLLLGTAGCAKQVPRSAKQPEAPDFDPLRNTAETNEKMFRLPVPFVCQAPTGYWKPPFDEACEETCLLMMQQHLAGNQEIDPLEAETEIRRLAELVAGKGHGIDIGVKTVGEIAAERYNLKTKIYEDAMVTPENIRRLLVNGYPVMLPVAQFKNEHFKSEAPYHMIVVCGFDTGGTEQKFITNDPGTRHGAGYSYSESYLLEHIHEWNGGRDTVSKAPKAMLVLGK